MHVSKLILKNYEQGFEKDQARIFNSVIHTLNPKAKLITEEKVLKRHQDKNFKPEQVKYLVNEKNEIVGYSEVRIFGDSNMLFYPLIMPTYNTPENIDYLLKSVYDVSLSFKPRIIQAIYNFNFPKVHRYFETQKVIKIVDKFVRPELYISLSDIELVPATSLKLEIFSQDAIEKLFNFLTSTDNSLKRITLAKLTDYYEKKVLSSDNSFLVTINDTIVGYVIFGTFTSEGDSTDVYTFMQDAIDSNYMEDIDIRRAFLNAATIYMKKSSQSKLVLFVFKPSNAYTLYTKLGLKENTYGRNIYTFETNSLETQVPYCNN